MPYCNLLTKPQIAVALLLVAACEHDAWLGMQCADPDLRCDDAGSAAHSGASDAGPSPEFIDSGASAKQEAGPPAGSDGHDASTMQDAATASACRSVSMSFFACASGSESAGAPLLLGGRAYTLRFRSAYKIDTTFQVQGSTHACTAVMLGTLTVPAGEALVERCLRPSEDLALLVTVTSGDLQVWMENGVMAELCEGCS